MADETIAESQRQALNQGLKDLRHTWEHLARELAPGVPELPAVIEQELAALKFDDLTEATLTRLSESVVARVGDAGLPEQAAALSRRMGRAMYELLLLLATQDEIRELGLTLEAAEAAAPAAVPPPLAAAEEEATATFEAPAGSAQPTPQPSLPQVVASSDGEGAWALEPRDPVRPARRKNGTGAPAAKLEATEPTTPPQPVAPPGAPAPPAPPPEPPAVDAARLPKAPPEPARPSQEVPEPPAAARQDPKASPGVPEPEAPPVADEAAQATSADSAAAPSPAPPAAAAPPAPVAPASRPEIAPRKSEPAPPPTARAQGRADEEAPLWGFDPAAREDAPDDAPPVPEPEPKIPATVATSPRPGVQRAESERRPEFPRHTGWTVRMSPRTSTERERKLEARKAQLPALLEEITAAAKSQREAIPAKSPARRALEATRNTLPLAEGTDPAGQIQALLEGGKLGDAAAMVVQLANQQRGEDAAGLACDVGDVVLQDKQLDLAVLCFSAAVLAAPPCDRACWKLCALSVERRDAVMAPVWLEFIARLLGARGADADAISVYRQLLKLAPRRNDIRELLRTSSLTGILPD